MTHSFQDMFSTSVDGLKLRGRRIGESHHDRLPILCLPGLTRTAEDFDVVADALANDPETPRLVIAVDYRGRGLSDYDLKPENYNVPVEANDVLTLASSAGIERTIILGTSRGGLIGMALAATKPEFVAGLALNDIGPELEIGGLMKIKGYISDPPPRKTWEDAAQGLKQLFGGVFTLLTDAEWMAWARRAFREDNGGLVRTYDPQLALTFAPLTLDNAPPPMWELFDKIADIPLLSIRGELSDLLSKACVEDMQRRRPAIGLLSVPDQGHPPLLTDAASLEAIKAFCRQCDTGA